MIEGPSLCIVFFALFGKLASWALNVCIILTSHICLHCIAERVAKQQNSLVRVVWLEVSYLTRCVILTAKCWIME